MEQPEKRRLRRHLSTYLPTWFIVEFYLWGLVCIIPLSYNRPSTYQLQRALLSTLLRATVCLEIANKMGFKNWSFLLGVAHLMTPTFCNTGIGRIGTYVVGQCIIFTQASNALFYSAYWDRLLLTLNWAVYQLIKWPCVYNAIKIYKHEDASVQFSSLFLCRVNSYKANYRNSRA
jgi:hypothetical protein